MEMSSLVDHDDLGGGRRLEVLDEVLLDLLHGDLSVLQGLDGSFFEQLEHLGADSPEFCPLLRLVSAVVAALE